MRGALTCFQLVAAVHSYLHEGHPDVVLMFLLLATWLGRIVSSLCLWDCCDLCVLVISSTFVLPVIALWMFVICYAVLCVDSVHGIVCICRAFVFICSFARREMCARIVWAELC